MRVLEKYGKFIQWIQYWLTLRGIDAGPPRKPLYHLNADEIRNLEKVSSTMNTTISTITGTPK